MVIKNFYGDFNFQICEINLCCCCFGIVCLFVELFAEMVQMVDVSYGLEDKIMKNAVFIDFSTCC